MATVRSIADEVAITLGFAHDDARLSFNALAYHVKIAVDKITARSLAKDMRAGDPRTMSNQLEVFTVPVTNNEANDDIPWNCLYFDLPKEIYNLPFDGGLAWVRYHRPSLPLNCPPGIAGKDFTHTTLGSLSRLWNTEYEKPKESRPYVARDKDRVYIFGVNPLVSKLLVGLYCALPDLIDMDPDETIPLQAHHLSDVRRLVIDNARFALLLPERLRNDGRDLDAPQPTEKQASINDPINIIGE